MTRTVTTADVLKARGVRSRKVLYQDRRAGLFADMMPHRTSSGYWSCDGVWLVWPAQALQRARLIRRWLEQGKTRQDVAAALLVGAA